MQFQVQMVFSNDKSKAPSAEISVPVKTPNEWNLEEKKQSFLFAALIAWNNKIS